MPILGEIIEREREKVSNLQDFWEEKGVWVLKKCWREFVPQGLDSWIFASNIKFMLFLYDTFLNMVEPKRENKINT